MRILFVASRFPWPLIHGDRLRAYHELRLLSRHHQIVLLSPSPDADVEENLSVIQPFCEKIEIISTPRWKRLWNLGGAFFTSLPLQTLYSYDPRMGQVASRLLQEKPFDLVHVQLMRMAPVVEAIRGVPTVIDFIDALSLNMARRRGALKSGSAPGSLPWKPAAPGSMSKPCCENTIKPWCRPNRIEMHSARTRKYRQSRMALTSPTPSAMKAASPMSSPLPAT